jgi:hypothetical protein
MKQLDARYARHPLLDVTQISPYLPTFISAFRKNNEVTGWNAYTYIWGNMKMFFVPKSVMKYCLDKGASFTAVFEVMYDISNVYNKMVLLAEL